MAQVQLNDLQSHMHSPYDNQELTDLQQNTKQELEKWHKLQKSVLK